METTDKTTETQVQEQQKHGTCNETSCHIDNPVEKTEASAVAKANRPAYVPAVDMIESENEVQLIADVPGVPEGGVDLTIEKGVLTLVATPADQKAEGKKLAYSEYGVGEYRCSFALSEEIDKDHIKATLKDGVLRVVLPKVAPVTKKIAVAAS